MRLSRRYGRRAAAVTTTFLVWMAVASGIVPLLHHAGDLRSSGCDSTPAAGGVAGTSVHGDGCPHGEEHHADAVDAHCPVCRALHQPGMAVPETTATTVAHAFGDRVPVAPAALDLGPDLPPSLAPRAPPHAV